MRLVQTAAPNIEPVTLALAKQHCRVDITDDDAYITSLITAARVMCEAKSHLSFITQSWSLYLDYWGNAPWDNQFTPTVVLGGWAGAVGSTIYNDWWNKNQVDLLHAPLISVESITYTDTSQTLQTFSPTLYSASLGSTVSRIFLLQSTYFPTIASQPDSVVINYTSGYGSTASSVPVPAIQAILLTVASLYYNRLDSAEYQQFDIPYSATMLLSAINGGRHYFA